MSFRYKASSESNDALVAKAYSVYLANLLSKIHILLPCY